MHVCPLEHQMHLELETSTKFSPKVTNCWSHDGFFQGKDNMENPWTVLLDIN